MDLILRGGRVIDPVLGLDATRDVGFANGVVAAVESRIAEKANEEHDVAGAIVTPGMIDLHTHVYWGGTSIGVEAEPIARRSGTTTFVDAGTAGPANFPGFRRHVIERSPVRILASSSETHPPRAMKPVLHRPAQTRGIRSCRWQAY